MFSSRLVLSLSSKEDMAKKSNQNSVQEQVLAQSMSSFQVLSARLLELSVVELEDRVRAEILENPALDEKVDEYDDVEILESPNTDEITANYRSEDDVPDYEWQERQKKRALQVEEIPFSEATSFFEMLQSQADERSLTAHQRQLAHYLIGSLDDDGFLRKSLTTIADELMWYMNIRTTDDELAQVLKVIQDFDPPGVGAKDLQECLLLQIQRKKLQAPHNPLVALEEKILVDHYKDFTNKQWPRIQQRLKADADFFQQAIDEICHLNPRPGASMGEFMERSNQQIVPDFIIETTDDEEITIALNKPNLPSLSLSEEFVRLLEAEEEKHEEHPQREGDEATAFLKQKVNAAQNFISALKLRDQTMMSTMLTIVAMQRPFFLEGDFALLKPMKRTDIAKKLQMDVSTISRVCNSKYAQTNFGIFALKDFFVDTFDSAKDAPSVIEIEQILKQLIDNEDKHHPYTDEELVEQLKQKGLTMARRTIAKYREQLSIPSVRYRKV